MLALFDKFQCTKIKIDTSEEGWDQYVQEIIALFGAKFKKVVPYPFDPGRYLGTYCWQKGIEADDWIISYDETNKCLYTSLF